MKTSNIAVALVAASGLFLGTSGWAKKPVSVGAGEPVPVAQKVLMCHKGVQAIDISVNAQNAHEAHGDWEVDEANPCPADGAALVPSACMEVVDDSFDVDAVIHPIAELPGPLFDIQEGLLYLPQVTIDFLGVIQTFAVILERFTDTDFVVRHVESLPEPVDGVAVVEFSGGSTVVAFDVAVVADDPELTLITDVEFSVLRGCRPVQVSATNFSIPQAAANP